jgi:7,8-dihydropterin-6-yl-methyl-4-(beta-D-ribofuranosyl)aminobenzene 5'-phosphate synthase
MKLTILVDNYVQNKNEARGEPSFSCYIEQPNCRILFDLGMTSLPYDNARKLGIDLSKTNAIVVSHGHLDHTWGLDSLLQKYPIPVETKFICHPDALKEKRYGKESIGIKKSETFLMKRFQLIQSKEPYWINKRTVFLGQIVRANAFENKEPLGKQKTNRKIENDYLLDDSALVYDGNDGMVIITGCSHSGICNIIEYSKSILGKKVIKAVIGGFHMQNEEMNNTTKRTVDYIRKQNIGTLYPCHCTNLFNKMALSRAANVAEIGAGSIIEYRKI